MPSWLPSAAMFASVMPNRRLRVHMLPRGRRIGRLLALNAVKIAIDLVGICFPANTIRLNCLALRWSCNVGVGLVIGHAASHCFRFGGFVNGQVFPQVRWLASLVF